MRRPRLNACLQSRQLLTKRLKELKAALAARAALGAVARQSPTPAMSSSSTVASDPPRPTDYFPPSAEAGPSRLPSFPQSTHLGMHPQFSGDVSGNASPLAGYRALSFSVGENSAPAPPPRVQNIPSIRRPRQAPTPPPDIEAGSGHGGTDRRSPTTAHTSVLITVSSSYRNPFPYFPRQCTRTQSCLGRVGEHTPQ